MKRAQHQQTVPSCSLIACGQPGAGHRCAQHVLPPPDREEPHPRGGPPAGSSIYRTNGSMLELMGHWGDLTGEPHPLSTPMHMLQYAQKLSARHHIACAEPQIRLVQRHAFTRGTLLPNLCRRLRRDAPLHKRTTEIYLHSMGGYEKREKESGRSIHFL